MKCFRSALLCATAHLKAVASRPIIELDRHPICEQSGEQHRKSRALVLIASTNPQFTADPLDKRPNNPHSQSFAGGWIKSFRPNRAIIGDRQRVALPRIRFQPDRDAAFAVFGRVRDQLIDDEAERNAGDGRQLDFNPLDDDDPLRALLGGQHRGEIATKILEVLLERYGLYAIQIMETLVDASNRGHAIGRDGQLRSGFGIRRRPALQPKKADDHLQAVQKSMIGLVPQNLLLLDQLVLLTKQSLFSGESLSQPDFRAPMFCKLVFVARDRAALRALKYGVRR